MFKKNVLILLIGYISISLTANDEWVLDTRDLSEYPSYVGEVYFVSSKESKIYHISTQGRELTIFGRRGEGPGEFDYYSRIQYLSSDDSLFVVDYRKDQFVEF